MFYKKSSLELFTFNSFSHNGGPVQAMSTRAGGISQGVYRCLNLGFHVGDDDDSVLANRIRFCRTLSIPLESLVVGQQVHGTDVAVVTGRDRGRGSKNQNGGLPRTDALVTSSHDVALMILVADCAAVLLYDPVKEVIGIAHGSWRGTVGDIGRKTVRTMVETFGTHPRNLRAAISPSIGPCCYEVGEEVVSALQISSPEGWEDLVIDQDDGSIHFNLWEALRQQLTTSGIPEERIETAGLCTACHTDLFFSHRKEKGETGRNGIVISLQQPK